MYKCIFLFTQIYDWLWFFQRASNNNHDMFLHWLSSKPSKNSGVQPVIQSSSHPLPWGFGQLVFHFWKERCHGGCDFSDLCCQGTQILLADLSFWKDGLSARSCSQPEFLPFCCGGIIIISGLCIHTDWVSIDSIDCCFDYIGTFFEMSPHPVSVASEGLIGTGSHTRKCNVTLVIGILYMGHGGIETCVFIVLRCMHGMDSINILIV